MSEVKLNALGQPALQPKTPVPSDIEISQDIVRDVGLLSMQELSKQYVHAELLIMYAAVATSF